MKKLITSTIIVGMVLVGCVENTPTHNIPIKANKKNIQKFSKDITIIDGLMYQNQPFSKEDVKRTENGGRVWDKEEAKKYCSNLNLGGYSIWRLPNQIELLKLSNIEALDDWESDKVIKKWFEKNKNRRNINSRGYKFFIKKEFIENMPDDKNLFFWISEESIHRQLTYALDFTNGGRIDKILGEFPSYTLCVRSQIDKNIDKKKIITIKGTTYQNQVFNHKDKNNYDLQIEGSRVWSWEGAKKYCNTLQLEGKKWRLPTGEELNKLKIDRDEDTIIEGKKVSVVKEIAQKFQGGGRFWTSDMEKPKDRQKRRVGAVQGKNEFQVMMMDLLFPDSNPSQLLIT